MGRVCVFLADGFEEIEGLMVVDLLRRGGIEVTTVSIMGNKSIMGRSKIEVNADTLFEEMDYSDVDMLVLPGGMPGTTFLGNHAGLHELIMEFARADKKIAAICAAPTILGEMGLLEGKTATCYPGLEDKLFGAKLSEKKVEVDGNITTSRGLGTSITFSLKLIEELEGKERALQVKEDIVFLHKWA